MWLLRTYLYTLPSSDKRVTPSNVWECHHEGVVFAGLGDGPPSNGQCVLTDPARQRRVVIQRMRFYDFDHNTIERRGIHHPVDTDGDRMCTYMHVNLLHIETETEISKCTVIMGRDHGHPYILSTTVLSDCT